MKNGIPFKMGLRPGTFGPPRPDDPPPGGISLDRPKGIPEPAVKKLEDGFRKAMDDADFQAVMKKFDFTPAYLGSEDYEKLVREDSEKIQKLVKKLGLDKEQ